MRKLSSRRGFTLAEVLVTVTIVAVLAAVMVPAVINQVAKGDVPSVNQDVSGIRTAITTFAADTRRFPGMLSQLGGTSLTAGDKDFTHTATFGADASANYHGPYASITAGHIGPTGAVFSDSLMNPASTRYICMRDSTSGGGTAGTSKITAAQIAQLRLALDSDTTTYPTGTSTGTVRWTATTSTGVTTVSSGTVRVCLTTY